MIQAKYRRLSNTKTKRETGLEYVVQNLDIQTPFGRKVIKDMEPYFPGEEEELKRELERVNTLLNLEKEDPTRISKIQECFMEIKDSSYTLKRAANSTLSAVEIYEIKSLLLAMLRYSNLTENKIPQEYVLEDTTDLLDILDPRKDRINTFYIYDEFSPKLGELRNQKRNFEIEIRKEQKNTREEIRKTYGVQLTPKFDITVAKSNRDLEKIKNIPELEVADEDYMSVHLILKTTPAIFDITKRMEELVAEIDEEENKILTDLSLKISEKSTIIKGNAEKIGQFDFALARALFAEKHNCTKPEVVSEHIIEITDGRNIQVEDILKSKGKEYCPVSISLRNGVTLITGANMGGKTISLKLSGQIPMLTQYGFFVPAKKAVVGLSNYVQILIGDSQSVERGLSSFGSEMEELKEILDNCVDRSLVFMDEIASGTNPKEGLALTRSIIDYLKDKPYISLITTHYETATEADGVTNMQVVGLKNCDFTLLNREIQHANRKERINIISKYMDYRLCKVENLSEVPKDALNIAKMLGISSEIIDGAKKYIM